MAAGRYQMGSTMATRRGRGGFEDGIAPARGVECAPMNAEVAAIGPSRAALPGIADYLRAIWDLGRRSLKPALPALAFLYFYRLGMGAYIAMSDYGYPHGADAIGAIVPQIVVIASFVPLLLLVYTPFLPLQDALLRGREMSFLAAIRRVLETAWNFMLSGIAQMLVFFVPVAVILVLAGIMIPSTGGEAASARLLAMSVAFLGGFTWCLVAGILMIFATPAVVLDGEGPVQSIRTSFRLVTRNLGGVLGRLIAFAFLSFVVYVFASMPATILTTIERSSGLSSAPLKIASVVWSSAMDTVFFPFWVAALMVLYRALLPYSGEERVGAPVAIDEEFQPASATHAPFE